MSRSKVQIQKGLIDPNPLTMKQMTHEQRLEQGREQNALRRHAQTLDLHMPKEHKGK